MNFYTLHQGNITNKDFLEKINNMVNMVSEFKVQLHDQPIIDIVTEEKYPAARYDIIDPKKKEAAKQASKEQYLKCAFIFQRDINIYGGLIEEIENGYTKGNNNHPE